MPKSMIKSMIFHSATDARLVALRLRFRGLTNTTLHGPDGTEMRTDAPLSVIEGVILELEVEAASRVVASRGRS